MYGLHCLVACRVYFFGFRKKQDKQTTQEHMSKKLQLWVQPKGDNYTYHNSKNRQKRHLKEEKCVDGSLLVVSSEETYTK